MRLQSELYFTVFTMYIRYMAYANFCYSLLDLLLDYGDDYAWLVCWFDQLKIMKILARFHSRWSAEHGAQESDKWAIVCAVTRKGEVENELGMDLEYN